MGVGEGIGVALGVRVSSGTQLGSPWNVRGTMVQS